MTTRLTRNFVASIFALAVLAFLSTQAVAARALLSYSPPSQISVRMYWLTESGARREPYTLCASGDTRCGCTAFCDESGYPCEHSQTLPYPYSTNPVTIPIETDYLLDVVPQEMGMYYQQSTALQAQAITARSYACWHINNGSNINNSTQFQAFIPYKFESLPSTTFPDNPSDPCASSNLNANQRIVCNAVTPRHYISYDSDLPAFTEFSSDVWGRTVAGGLPYLIAVDNPISTGCDANNYGHGRGMSQEGANRWAQGNRCSYAAQGDEPWSVRWHRAEQILIHYYTGIHIRDANGATLTPSYRWNPLRINWGTPDNWSPIMYHGSSYAVTITVQNTSIYNWPRSGSSWALSYHWAKAGFSEMDSSNRAWTTVDVPKGDPPYVFTLTINDIPSWGQGVYMLKLDMVLLTYGQTFWFSRTYNWPTHDVRICIDGPCKIFVPVVLKNSTG